MSKTALGPCLFLLLGLLAAPVRAGEAWPRHRADRASVAPPPGWSAGLQSGGARLTAIEPGDRPLRLLLERVSLLGRGLEGDGAARCRAFADLDIQERRRTSAADRGLKVLRAADHEAAGLPVRWTWMARPYSDHPGERNLLLDRTLFLHAVLGVDGYVLRVDVHRARAESGLPEQIASTFLVGPPGANEADPLPWWELLDLFRHQSYALVRMLNEADDGRWRRYLREEILRRLGPDR